MKKEKRIHIMISEKELEVVKKKAEEKGLNLSAFMRLKALGKI